MHEQLWVVRAGRQGVYSDQFFAHKMVAIGWGTVGDLSGVNSRQEVAERLDKFFPEYTRTQKIVNSGQIFRFKQDLAVGTEVCTYVPSERRYRLGKITGGYVYRPQLEEELQHTREVEWGPFVLRDELTASSKNSLGSIATIFCVSEDAAAEMMALSNTESSIAASLHPEVELRDVEDQEQEAEAQVRQDIEQKALEFLQDRLNKVTWDNMQELVAGLLRAMGYKTKVSTAGADRGRDIVASPDGFGFQSPRIIVEVKHRKGSMGAPEIRSFLGGLRAGDNGLYVSTGGFTREARYEADRANHHLSLMDIEELGRAVMEHYDRMDADTRALLPLKKLYWPG